MYNIIAQLVGYLGIAANMIIYQQKNHKKLLIYKGVSDILWMAHYIMIGATMGAIVAGIALCREIVFINNNKKWAQTKLWLVLFMLISICSSLLKFSAESFKCFLPMIASVTSIISFWQPSPKVSRFLSFPVSACMITYGILNASIPAVMNEVLTITSSLVGVIRYDIKGHKHNTYAQHTPFRALHFLPHKEKETAKK